MKPTAFRYGLYASLVLLVLFLLNYALFNKSLDYATQEVIGYLTIVLSMFFIFLGIRHYRNHLNMGRLSFGEGMKLGILIALIPAIFFGLFNLLYVEVIDPGWREDYYSHYIEQVKANTAPEAQQEEIAALEKQREFFSSPVMTFLVMFATVFIVGVIATIISALALRRSRPFANA
jgi:ABC-type sugar transport system permease subunit